MVRKLRLNKLVRVCERGVLKYRQTSKIAKNSPVREGGKTSKEGMKSRGGVKNTQRGGGVQKYRNL